MSFDPNKPVAFVQQLKESNDVIIRSFHTKEELIERVQAAIDSGKRCVVWPKLLWVHRMFYTVENFRSSMNEVEAELRDHETLAEPDMYKSLCLFAVGPKRSGRR